MSKKIPAPSTSSSPVIANCSRTSNFAAHRCGDSERRLTTHHPLFLFAIAILLFIHTVTRELILNACGMIATAITNAIATALARINLSINIQVSPIFVLVVVLFIFAMIVLSWWFKLLIKENERCTKAAQTRYYFYDDIIEFCTKEKRESFRTVNGIVSVRVSPAINEGFVPTLMTWIVALLSLNSKSLWQRKYGFRDVTIVTLGSPSETIILHDVEDPDTLVKNIKKHYPMCNIESFGNGFSIK